MSREHFFIYSVACASAVWSFGFMRLGETEIWGEETAGGWASTMLDRMGLDSWDAVRYSDWTAARLDCQEV